jgi:hypothetical protein
MPTASGKNVGEALARVANKYKKRSMTNSLKNMLNKARRSGDLVSSNGNDSSVSTNMGSPKNEVSGNSNANSNAKSQCMITPGGQKMRKEKGKWVKCTAGGKRKTRKSKKSRRHQTRRRR